MGGCRLIIFEVETAKGKAYGNESKYTESKAYENESKCKQQLKVSQMDLQSDTSMSDIRSAAVSERPASTYPGVQRHETGPITRRYFHFCATVDHSSVTPYPQKHSVSLHKHITA